MRKLLVLQHVPFEPLGHLDPLLRASGFRIRYVNFGRLPHSEPDLRRYDGLVVLGGPMNVDQQHLYPHLATEIECLRTALARDLPILGICLGAQLLAASLGADVHPAPTREIGWYPLRLTEAAGTDRLFRHFGPHEPVFQWHGYTFQLPPGAVHLAGTAHCPHQAFRHGERAYGLQFHLEADDGLIGRWLGLSDSVGELEPFGGERHAERVRRDSARHLPAARQLAAQVFGEFVRLFEPARRMRILPTR